MWEVLLLSRGVSIVFVGAGYGVSVMCVCVALFCVCWWSCSVGEEHGASSTVGLMVSEGTAVLWHLCAGVVVGGVVEVGVAKGCPG